jgi:hypothetical protein
MSIDSTFIEQTENWQDQYRFKCNEWFLQICFRSWFLLKDEMVKPSEWLSNTRHYQTKEEEQRLKLLETVFTQSKTL